MATVVELARAHKRADEEDRNMHKAGLLTGACGTLGWISGSVLAATEEKSRATLSVDELSLYTAPQTGHCAERERGQLEETLSGLRKQVEPCVTWCQQASRSAYQKAQGVYAVLKPKADGAIGFGRNGLEFVKNPPAEFYPRVAVIGFTGIVGLFLGRSSRWKRLMFPAGLMSVATSLYYPQEAVTLAKATGDSLYDWTIQVYVTAEMMFRGQPESASVTERTKTSPEDTSNR